MSKRRKTQILGITGSFGSGKTTVASMFKKLGAVSIDADRIYHGLIKPKQPLYERIIAGFGKGILGKNRQIDRKKIAKLVFAKKVNLRKLCRITHPAIIKKMKSELSGFKKEKRGKIIVIDAPLLVEAGLTKMVDKLIVVKTSRDTQIKRSARRWGIFREEATRRIKAQVPLAKKIKLADFVIDNQATFPKTRKQVKNIWQKLK